MITVYMSPNTRVTAATLFINTMRRDGWQLDDTQFNPASGLEMNFVKSPVRLAVDNTPPVARQGDPA